MGFLNFFNNYSDSYIKKYPPFKKPLLLKKEHTLRVAAEAKEIARSLNLEDKDIEFSFTTGLFHDIGRFPQFVKYQTFNDRISEDHGKLSALELIKTGIIHEFQDKKDILIFCTFFHNKKDLPKLEYGERNSSKIKFLKILRDADKLDIFNVMIKRYNEKNDEENSFIEMGLPDTDKTSVCLMEEIKSRKSCSFDDVKSLNDLKLLQMSWVFDMNYDFSLKEIKKRRIVEKIFETMKPCDGIDLCFEQIKEYMNTRTAKL